MIVTGVLVYPSGTMRLLSKSIPGVVNPHVRGEVKSLSRKSRERMAFVVSETTVDFKSMLTLTYPKMPECNQWASGKKIKQHLNKMLKWIRSYWGCVGYFWFLEFQKNGSPHYHILLDVAPDNRDRFFAALHWSEIIGLNRDDIADKVFWVHSRKEAFDALREKEGAKRYVLKYSLKPEQKEVPKGYRNVGRFWGCNKKVIDGILPPYCLRGDEDAVRHYVSLLGFPQEKFEHLPMIMFSRTIVSRETIDITQGQDNTL